MAFPTLLVEFSPTTGPFATPVWISLTAGPHGNRVLSAEWTDGKQADFAEFPPGQATIVLSNNDRLFDPDHTAGTYTGKLNPRVPFRIRSTHAGVTRDHFYGFVEDGWEQDYRPPEDSTCKVQLVDMLTVLAGYKLLTPSQHEYLADSPRAYWSLDETTGTVMGDRSGLGNDGTYDNATLGEDPLIIDGTGKAALFLHEGDNRGQYKGDTLPTAAPVTLEAWVKFDRESTQIHTILVAQRDNAFLSRLWLYVGKAADSPNGEVIIAFDGFGGQYKARGSTRIDDGLPHHVVMTMSSTAAADIKLYVDGQLETKTVISGTTGGSWTAHLIWCVGNVAASEAFDFGLGGTIDEVAIYNTALSAVRVLAHYNAGATGFEGQRSDQQIAWALGVIGVPATMYNLDVGRSIMGPAETSGRDLLAFVREVTATEQGSFYVDHSDGGKLRFCERYTSFLATRSTVTQGTFSDDPAASFSTVVRVEAGTLKIEPNGVSSIINQATVKWRGGSETVTAAAPYGPRGISIDTQSATPAIARGVGEWIVALNSLPQTRVRSLGANPGAAQTAFPTVLALKIRDRVTYRSKPQDLGAAMTKALEVLGRRHTVRGRNWSAVFYLTTAPNSANGGVTLFTLGTSTLGGTHILAY